MQAERTPRSERKRRDSFGMFDGYDSCSEESTSSSSSEDSEDEVVPPIPASLPIIKNNGQVYTYPDGKAGMGKYAEGGLELLLCLDLWYIFVCVHTSMYKFHFDRSHFVLSSQLPVRCVGWSEYEMLFTPKPSASAACRVQGVTPRIPKRPASWQGSR